MKQVIKNIKLAEARHQLDLYCEHVGPKKAEDASVKGFVRCTMCDYSSLFQTTRDDTCCVKCDIGHQVATIKERWELIHGNASWTKDGTSGKQFSYGTRMTDNNDICEDFKCTWREPK